MTTTRRLLVVLIVVLLAAVLGGCGSGAATAPTLPDDSARIDPTPSDGNDGGGENGSNGGVVAAPDEGGGGGIGQPGIPEPVVPRPGQLMVHPVGVSELLARRDGRHVVLNARWWSGVEPCAVLDSVGVARDGDTITVTLFEGTSDPDVACIAIAVEKVTVIDLGELEPGTYTITADPGEGAAIVVKVP
jgi:hypothetical protein